MFGTFRNRKRHAKQGLFGAARAVATNRSPAPWQAVLDGTEYCRRASHGRESCWKDGAKLGLHPAESRKNGLRAYSELASDLTHQLFSNSLVAHFAPFSRRTQQL
jgi:hypothetical protein